MRFLIALLLGCLSLTNSLAQDSTLVLDTAMFNAEQQIFLASADGWVYQPGNNPAWASPGLNTSSWRKRKPTELSIKDVDKTGRVEGWFRLRLKLDSTFKNMPVWFRKSTWSAVDLYIDGNLLASYGSTGAKGEPYHDYYFIDQSPTSVPLVPGREYLISLHIVDYKAPFSLTKLKSEIDAPVDQALRLVGPKYQASVTKIGPLASLAYTLQFAAALFTSLLLWLLVFQQVGDQPSLRLLAIQCTLTALNGSINMLNLAKLSPLTFSSYRLSDILTFLTVALLPVILLRIVGHPHIKRFTIGLFLLPVVAFVIDTVIGPIYISTLAFALELLFLLYVIISFRNKLHGAPRSIVMGIILAFVFALLFVLNSILVPQSLLRGIFIIILGTAYSSAIPLSFLVYVALRFKEILAEDRAKAAAVVQITEEKRAILATQNQLLEQQVEARTAELKASQAQLIQKEKLASLGELTAGIAHEIQNPLNFVNNFSEVSTELVEELEAEQHNPQRDPEVEAEILGDLKQNLLKITQHGSRAASIIKGMLAHSRPTTGEVEPTDLNALADEYLRLSFQGLRAKDKNFSCELVTQFDPTLSSVELVPQEIGRVLLNLFNNAFYAVRERQKQADSAYQPRVTLRTAKTEKSVEIRVNDNGTGIPQSVKAKIFQPFFTTKPTGEGTGLGLSLSYDIVTKGHGGSLTVESQEGEGTAFVIQLPALS
ncbi:hypothetical protein GCM10028818_22560 [Spirosoma horti]